MARIKGIVNYSSNFEVRAQGPLDARMLVEYYSDLVNPATWQDSESLIWLFNGAMVVVSTDPSAGVYWLKDAPNYTDYASWVPVGMATPFDPSALYAYIDGSLALRDSSISNLYSITQVLDSSIGYLIDWKGGVDASIIRIDGSLNIIFNLMGALDASIIRIDSSLAEVVESIDSLDASIIRIDSSLGELLAGSPFVKESSLGSNFIWDASGYLDVSVAGGSSGPSIDGGVWITNITPASGGNVGDKIYSSDGAVLDSCLTDTSSLTVHVLALPGHTNYKPYIYINGNPVTISATSDKPVFTGTYNMTYAFTDASITVHHEDGASWSTIVDADTPAVILSADFINGYPGSQTELKAGDIFDVRVQTDVSIVSVQVDDYGAFQSGTYTVSGNNVTFTGTIANRGTSVQSLGMRIRVVKSTGSTSASYLSASQGSVDGKDLVKLNNLYPTATWGTITYPGIQRAIKLGDTASVVNTLANYDSVIYSSPNGELGIAAPTTPANPLTVSYSAGTYNISNNNLRISANRAANNATTTNDTTVWIANTPATLSVSHAPGFSSGGNDGTLVQNHQVGITSSQRLLSYPTLVKGSGGTWANPNFTWTPTATLFTNNLSVNDNMTKGTYSWGAISGTNLAGIVTTTNSGTTQYDLRGFVVRTLTLPAFGWQAIMNVAVYDYSKLSSSGSGQILDWTVVQHVRSTLGDITRPNADHWSASATGTNPTTINILDKSATDSQSQATTFTIQEGI